MQIKEQVPRSPRQGAAVSAGACLPRGPANKPAWAVLQAAVSPSYMPPGRATVQCPEFDSTQRHLPSPMARPAPCQDAGSGMSRACCVPPRGDSWRRGVTDGQARHFDRRSRGAGPTSSGEGTPSHQMGWEMDDGQLDSPGSESSPRCCAQHHAHPLREAVRSRT